MPLVSIIINNYNYGHFLREAIESALNQTYPNIEVIVVDDGSTDNSREIIAEYEDRIIPVLKENGGQASAFNAGFAVSRGEIICFLDSDDVWLPNKVDRVVEVFQTAEDVALVQHNLRLLITGKKTSGNTLVPGIRHFSLEKISSELILVRRRNAPTSALCLLRSKVGSLFPVPEKPFRKSWESIECMEVIATTVT